MSDPSLISPTGELDLASVESFRTLVQTAAGNSGRAVIIDLSQVSFIDSIGLGALIEIHARFREERRDLCVVAPERSVAAHLLARTGFARRLRVFESRSEALASFGSAEG